MVASDSKGPRLARRHHYVSQAYLERFATDGAVAVRRRDSRAFTSHPVNVAVECGLYELPDDVAAGFTQAETALGPYDAAAIAAIRDTADTGEAPGPGSTQGSS